MKLLLIQTIILFISSSCFASNYVVETVVDRFIVYDDEPVLIEILLKSKNKEWIKDKSKRSNFFKPECKEEDEFSTFIAVEVEGLGLKEIGPYEFSIGNELIETKPIKIYKIPRKPQPPDFEIISKKDPNGSGLFHIKIEYFALKEKNGLHVLEIDHENLPQGVQFKSGSSSITNDRVFCDFTLKILSKNRIVLNKENFIDIPGWITFPEIIIN